LAGLPGSEGVAESSSDVAKELLCTSVVMFMSVAVLTAGASHPSHHLLGIVGVSVDRRALQESM
jgi:hypothetical protein